MTTNPATLLPERLSGEAIRQSFLDFFAARNHTILPSASLLPASPNLLFTNAGMNPFVPIFLGQQKPDVHTWPGALAASPTRAADSQLCIRAGGKHNDLEDVGLDTYHHTLFEMLGNWSFGDYFKSEALAWAWELLTEIWNFPPHRLYATIYQPAPGDPATTDEEARDIWRSLFRHAGLDPDTHVLTGGKKDNFWMMGDTGPCGPCSEIHVDLTPAADTHGCLVNASSPLCIEIWNNVFIQYNALPDGSLEPLPSRHVDTGMGLERVAAILQATRGFTTFPPAERLISNYDTDLFAPLFATLSQITGKQYHATLPTPSQTIASLPQTQRDDIAFRVIADHLRALCFAIADGILPSNDGRGYVLRRILRRAVRFGRDLGLNRPFLHTLAATLQVHYQSHYPQLATHASLIAETLQTEEQAFHRTLEKGLALFESEVAKLTPTNTTPILSGDTAFLLADTYGFPLDLTQLLARERGINVDTARFETLLEEQRTRARAARRTTTIEVTSVPGVPHTEFIGYQDLICTARVLWQRDNLLALDLTPFYAEMGGQVSDTGQILIQGQPQPVTDVKRTAEGVILHALAEPPVQDLTGQPVTAEVNPTARFRTAAHHTLTHLLHWALRELLGPSVSQKGSYVGPDRLRFDFSHGAALTDLQLSALEQMLQQRIAAADPISWLDAVPYSHVRQRTDILQFFSDKYGDSVRVVQIGGHPGQLDGYSMELCAGTHLYQHALHTWADTSAIGHVKILSESAIAAGIRRIELVAGLASADEARARLAVLREKLSALQTKITAHSQ